MKLKTRSTGSLVERSSPLATRRWNWRSNRYHFASRHIDTAILQDTFPPIELRDERFTVHATARLMFQFRNAVFCQTPQFRLGSILATAARNRTTDQISIFFKG